MTISFRGESDTAASRNGLGVRISPGSVLFLANHKRPDSLFYRTPGKQNHAFQAMLSLPMLVGLVALGAD